MGEPQAWDNKGFRRWMAAGPPQFASALPDAAETILAPLVAAGFQATVSAFDGSSVPAHTLNLERQSATAGVDFVQLIFDKRRRLRFQLAFGTKEANSPHRWIRAGSLVWKQGSEDVRFKWWGARWFHLDKAGAFEAAVARVARHIHQVDDYLSRNLAGAIVRPVPV